MILKRIMTTHSSNDENNYTFKGDYGALEK